jgi:hypothetical protein
MNSTAARDVAAGASRWFKRAQPQASHVSAIRPEETGLTTEAGGSARPGHALTCMVTSGHLGRNRVGIGAESPFF